MKQRHSILLTGLGALCALALPASAVPAISRLTPPSALFSFGDAQPPIIARYLPGQRFDLQCTARPEAGHTISSVVFSVDGKALTKPVALVTTGLVAGLPAGTTVATTRAFSLTTPGVHTFSAAATQEDGQKIEATGNFEVVRIPGLGSLKNVIVMIGDGMGASHRTAARIVSKGVMFGKANAPLNMDTFPYTGMVETSSLNSIITDSAPGAACYSSGNKCNNNQQGVFPDDTVANFDNPRVELIGEFLARKQNKALGIVTTADVFDATPAAFASHTQARAAGTGICDGYLDEMAQTANLQVLMGGGRKWFLPNDAANNPGNGSARGDATDSVLPDELVTGWALPAAAKGALDKTRDLIADFQTAGFAYAPTKAGMTAAAAGNPTKLLGLFALSNMNVSLDKINGRRGNTSAPNVVAQFGFPDQPMLDEMTDTALQVLNRNAKGFVLMVEGASIDKQAHNMDAERWILDTIEFDRAIGVAKAFAAAHKDTLVIITADHECSGAAIIGASTQPNSVLVSRAANGAGAGTFSAPGLRNGLVGTYDAAGFPSYQIAPDGFPISTDIDNKLLIGYGANGDRYEDWLTNPYPLVDSQQPSTVNQTGAPASPLTRDTQGNFLVTGQVPDSTAVHTASDIPLSAFGRGAQYFSGYYDNTEVFFKIMRLVGAR